MKSVRIRSYSGPYFPTFKLNNSEYQQFLHSDMRYATPAQTEIVTDNIILR